MKDLFAKTFRSVAKEFKKLKGDASARKIHRIRSGKTSAIGVWGPDKSENRAFLEFSRHFKKLNLPVPEIYAEDRARGIYLEEDLGDVTLFDYLKNSREDGSFPLKATELYKKAVLCLIDFQTRGVKGLNLNYCYPRRKFDKRSMLWDMNYFKYYFLKLGNIPFNEQKLENDFNAFSAFLLKARDNYLLYRDFQSRNIMIRGSNLFFIDYQGARKGALQYDLASLLYDGKADLPAETKKALLDFYLRSARGKIKNFDAEEFLKFFPACAYIRIMQAMGAYGLRGFYERKTHFLESIPYAVKNIEYLLTHYRLPVKLPELEKVFKSIAASSYLRQFGKARLGLTVRINSFSYRGGIPPDERGHGGGFVFDCRTLPNPGKLAAYAGLTGKDAGVIEFLEKRREPGRFLKRVFSLATLAVNNYLKRNFSDLFVSFGCTGGRHRSVYCAEKLKKRLEKIKNVNVEIKHTALGDGP